MRARLARWLAPADIGTPEDALPTGRLKHTVATGDGSLFVWLTVEEPKSSRGRSLTLYVAPDEVDDLLRLCRDAAINRRNRPMVTS